MKRPIYEVRQLDASCWCMEENGVRAFLVTGKDLAVLIDSGYGTGNIKELVDNITEFPIKLVNTHADRDHIGCNRIFEKAHMHPAEYDRYHRAVGADAHVEPLWEGDVIELGGRRLEVILIPGHTPGSIALLDAENRILFGGDSVQTGTIFMFAQGRNIAAYIASMQKLQENRSRFDTVYPSHGPVPVGSDIIEGLLDGARKIQSGEIKGAPTTFKDLSVNLCDVGVAKFLLD